MSNIAPILERLMAVQQAFPSMVQEQAARYGTQIAAALHDAAPKGEGSGEHLADSFASKTANGSDAVIVTVTSNQAQKLKWVVFGTGIYGPRGGRIVPTTKRALFWEGAAHPYRSIAGMRPNDFVRPTLERELASMDGLLSAMAQETALLFEEGA